MKYFVYRGKRHYIKFVKSESDYRDHDGNIVYKYSCGDFIEWSDCREVTSDFLVCQKTTIESFLKGKEEEIKSYYSELVEDRIGYKCIFGEVKHSTSSLEPLYVPVICKVRIPKGALVYDGPYDSKKRATEAYIEKIYSIKESCLLMQKEYDVTAFIRPVNASLGIKALRLVGPFNASCIISPEEYLKCDGNIDSSYYSPYELSNSKMKEDLTVYKEGMHIDLNNVFNFEPKQCAAGFHYFDSDLHAAGLLSRVCLRG